MNGSTGVGPQRVRVVFAKGEAVKYVSHLALMRAWERIVRRADLPIAYSQGFNPRPRLTFASALPVGSMGCAEVMDMELSRYVEVDEIRSRLAQQLPHGFAIETVIEVPSQAPKLQADVRYGVYRVTLDAVEDEAGFQDKLRHLMEEPSLLVWREHKGRMREHDLRPLIHDLWYVGRADGRCVMGMILVVSNAGAGRPDEVLRALGLSEHWHSVTRVRLLFAGDITELYSAKALVTLQDGHPCSRVDNGHVASLE